MTTSMKPASEILSPREIEIASSYADGDTYQKIADHLCIAPSTVRTHLATVYRKLEVSSKIALLARLNGDQPSNEDQTDHAAVISELALSLEEALRRERTMSEVLKIISRSQGNIDVVMAAILGFALELCEAEFGVLLEHHGNNLFSASFSRGIPPAFRDWFEDQGVFAPSAQTGLGRMENTHEVINIFDVRAEKVYHTDDPLRHATAELGGARSFVAIPMLSGDRLVGAFTIYRQQVRPFSREATDLAHTFADQSVIALENVRMVSGLRSSN